MNPGLFSSAGIQPELRATLDEAIRVSRGGNTALGVTKALAGVRTARRAEDDASMLEALNTLAICQAAHGAFIEAVANGIDAFHLARGRNDRLGMAHALTTLAGASGFILDSLEPAVELLGRCLEMALALGDSALAVRIRNIRGILLGNLKRFEEAERDFDAALASIGEAGPNTPHSLVACNLAALMAKAARVAGGEEREALWRRGEELTDSAFELARRDGNIEAQSRMHFNRGDLAIQKGQVERGLREFETSHEIGYRLRHRARVVDTQLHIGQILESRGELEPALKIFGAAHLEAEGLRPTRILADVTERMAAIHERLGNAQAAARMRAVAGEEAAEYERASRVSRHDLLALYEAARGSWFA